MQTIDAFVELETIIEGEAYPLEVSNSNGIQDVIEKHLAATFRTTIGEQPDVTRVYGFQIGSRIELKLSNWSANFEQKHGAELAGDPGKQYDKVYEVVDIAVEYTTQNLRRMLPTPLIVIRVTLRPC